MGALACGSLDIYPADILRMRATLPGVAEAIGAFTGVGQVVDWMATFLVRPSVDLVAMDEFEYDFLVELKHHDCWLAFGVT
ncbi:MAG: hypothetical protein HYX68_09970 [Planctomycetes bacterium]|jgi:hypothetical protein|nr:hypothetical protein [Planctomycetota bacterium]